MDGFASPSLEKPLGIPSGYLTREQETILKSSKIKGFLFLQPPPPRDRFTSRLADVGVP